MMKPQKLKNFYIIIVKMYQTLDDLEKNQNDIKTPDKRKKRLKWFLISL